MLVSILKSTILVELAPMFPVAGCDDFDYFEEATIESDFYYSVSDFSFDFLDVFFRELLKEDAFDFCVCCVELSFDLVACL